MLRVDIYGKSHNQLTIECRNMIMTDTCIHIVEPVGDMLLTDEDDCINIPKAGVDKIFIQNINIKEETDD